jgi:hypothetical protein
MPLWRDDVSTKSRTLKQKALHELEAYLVISLYLWAIFGMLEVHKSIILAENHIDFVIHGFALINALALAKVMLIAREFHVGFQFQNAPLIYPTLLKSVAYSLLLAVFKILEAAGLGLYRGKSFHESIAELGGGTLAGILALTLLVAMLLIPFFGFAELRRALGDVRLDQVFFRSHHVISPGNEP